MTRVPAGMFMAMLGWPLMAFALGILVSFPVLKGWQRLSCHPSFWVCLGRYAMSSRW